MLLPCGPPGQTRLDLHITNIWVKLFFPKNGTLCWWLPKFRFLAHMAVIKDQKSTLEMGRVSKTLSIRIYTFTTMGANMGVKNIHISGPRPFPKVRI